MNLYLYGHGGSANHGCEAIVRATTALLPDFRPVLYSNAPDQDARYGLDRVAEVLPGGCWPGDGLPMWTLCRALLKFRLIDVARRDYWRVGRRGAGVYLSIGGDNYCYDRGVETFSKLRARLARGGSTVILWGCSIEPALLEDGAFVGDLARYRMIFARESITYEALRGKGLGNVALYPDPAFALEERLYPGFGAERRNAVGINLSPMAEGREGKAGIVRENYARLIRHILDDTDMEVLLIPHVVGEYNDDRVPLARLAAEFRDCGGRVSMVADGGCRELKYAVARCRFFVGARTHAVIAAYSSRVPALALGYSVKARGIARDVFGDERRFVLPAQSLAEPDEMARAFDRLREEEGEVRARLDRFMPGYAAAARAAAGALRAVLSGEARP